MVLIPRSSVQERHPRHFFLRRSPFQDPKFLAGPLVNQSFWPFARPPFADGFASVPTGATMNPGDVEH